MNAPTVLIAHGDAMDLSDITQSMLAAGLYVAGPLKTVSDCLEWIDVNGLPTAAVIGRRLEDAPSDALLHRLGSAGVPTIVAAEAGEEPRSLAA